MAGGNRAGVWVLILALIVPGLAGCCLFGWYALSDWHALQEAYVQFELTAQRSIATPDIGTIDRYVARTSVAPLRDAALVNTTILLSNRLSRLFLPDPRKREIRAAAQFPAPLS